MKRLVLAFLLFISGCESEQEIADEHARRAEAARHTPAPTATPTPAPKMVRRPGYVVMSFRECDDATMGEDLKKYYDDHWEFAGSYGGACMTVFLRKKQ
jgi:hypothetical protein